jgi:polysaccharide biosynthesis/export protein
MLSEFLRRRFARAVFLVGALAFGWTAATAQTLSGTDIQSILQGVAQAPPTAPTQSSTAPLSASPQTMQPASVVAPSTTPSALENDFSTRAGVPLKQFGYDVFGTAGSVTATQMGAVQDSYVLGVGDQIQIIMVGHETATYVVTIDRDGRVILLNLPPIAAAGRTLGEVRAELAQRISSQFLGTKSYISVANIRQISVLVTGQVNVPGMRTLTALNTALDALVLSGGVKKTGSLRGIYIQRGTRRIPLDIYSIVSHGGMGAVGALTEGDRIVVPTLGPTVAVAGLVNLPGIYELAPGTSRIAASSLMALAGGPEIAGLKRLSKLELMPDGKTRMVNLPRDGSVANGEVLFVDANRSATNARVTLNGEVAVPGVHAITGASTIAQLLRDPDDLGPNAYTLFAVVVRHDPDTNFLKMIPFSVTAVFNGTEHLKLVDNDFVYVFNNSEVTALSQAAASQLFSAAQAPGVAALSQAQQQLGVTPTTAPPSAPGTTPATATSPGTVAAPSPTSLAQMATIASNLPTVSGAATAGTGAPAPVVGTLAGAAPTTTSGASATSSTTVTNTLGTQHLSNSLSDIATRLNVTQTALTNLASDYLVWVDGEVLNPGPLLAAQGATLQGVIDAAGGLQRQADLSGVTVTSTEIDADRGISHTLRNVYAKKDTDFARVPVRPFDAIAVRAVFSDRVGESITISGQVRYPGTYEITRDERLSSVIARAGGLTDESYAYGAVFTRQSAALAEAQANQREASMLNDEIVTLSSMPPIPGQTPPNFSYLATMATTLAHQPTLGRISIAVDPAILLAHPERDPLLETGDAVYIPKRPSTVSVTGEVLNQGAFAWKSELTLDDYMDMAGGETDGAEDSMVFVIMPDGTAMPSHSSWWSFGGNTRIPPGATIVVPRDPQPFNLQTFLSVYTDILSKVAITAASLAVINKP